MWKHTKTRLFVVCAPTTNTEKLQKLLMTMVAAGGIVADVKVLEVDPEDAPRFEGNTKVSRALDHNLETALAKYGADARTQPLVSPVNEGTIANSCLC